MSTRSVDRSDLKRQNRQSVYETIRASEGQVFTCAQISRSTGISLPTVTKIIAFFEGRGLLRALGTQESGALGRRPTLMQFVPDAYGSIGAAYDGKHLVLVGVDLNYQPRAIRRIRVRCTIGRLMDEVLPAQMDAFLDQEAATLGKTLSIGLALPVVMDTHNERTDHPAQLVGIADSYDFSPHCQALRKRYGYPVYIENDVNAAAIGEFRELGLGAKDDMAYITLGNGIGSGILLGGKLRRGCNYAAGEIGNMVCSVVPDGASTLEALLSPDALLDRFDYNVFDDTPPTNEELQDRVADYIARHLAFAIVNMASILDVERFVLGGFVLEALKGQVYRHIERYVSHSPVSGLSIWPATAMGAPARGVGAHACDKALDSIFMDVSEGDAGLSNRNTAH